MANDSQLLDAKQMSASVEDGLDKILGQWRAEGVTEDLVPMAVLGRIARLTKYMENAIALCHGEFGLGQGSLMCSRHSDAQVSLILYRLRSCIKA